MSPQLGNGDVTTVVVKVANLRIAECLQKYQEYFTGDARQAARAISAALDYEGAFYPVVEGTIKGARVRMILTDNKDAIALIQSYHHRKYQRVDSFKDAVKYMLASGDRQLIVKYGVTPWALPKSRQVLSIQPPASSRQLGPREPGIIVSDVGSVSTAARNTTPRKKPECTICLRPMKGHPKPSCHTLSRSLPRGDSKVSLAGNSPSASPSDTPASAAEPEVDDLVKLLAQNLTITSTPPGPVSATVDPTIPGVAASEGDPQRNSSRAFGAITHSAVMMAVGAGVAFTYLSL
ncbi:hypothetical protein DXG01_016445 [Tephrocybe rancida]|nr:hypothetical protein DXG01_016445 [Tephrocybe rancida]